MMNKHSAKHSEIDLYKKIMPVTWHPTRWWDWQLLEHEKKEMKPIFTDRVGKW